MSAEFTHLDELGASRMVDIGEKPISTRLATASGRVRMLPETLKAIFAGQSKKGNVLEVARLAGIMAAKRCDELIPLCHTLPLDAVTVHFSAESDSEVVIFATVRVTARTGVEMEALLAVSVAALTIYDMCKSRDRSMVIDEVRLEEKSGGRSGHYVRTDPNLSKTE